MLTVNHEYELDEMAAPIETLIESFPSEVQPYAIQIVTQQVRERCAVTRIRASR